MCSKFATNDKYLLNMHAIRKQDAQDKIQSCRAASTKAGQSPYKKKYIHDADFEVSLQYGLGPSQLTFSTDRMAGAGSPNLNFKPASGPIGIDLVLVIVFDSELGSASRCLTAHSP